MDSPPWILAAAAAGYLLGALPFGYLVSRLHGIDIFGVGSRNPGATNVRRILGARAGNVVFVLDFLKGVAAAGWPLCLALASAHPGGAGVPAAVMAAKVPETAGLAGAMLGHSFSCFTGFKGGKGVATGAGAFLVLAPLATFAAAAVWIAAFFASRYVSLASILAALAVPVMSFLTGEPAFVSIAAAAVWLFVVVRHRSNIARLLNGTENRFGRKPEVER